MRAHVVMASLALLTAPSLAHEGPRFWVGNVDGVIATFSADSDADPTTYFPSRLFATEFGSIFGVHTTEFPGFEVRRSDGHVNSGTTFGFEIAGAALFFDAEETLFRSVHETFGPPEPGPVPQLAVSLGSSVRVTTTGAVAGFNFFTFHEVGDHSHLAFTLLGDGSSPVDGPSGVYCLPLRLSSTSLATSETFYLLLGKGVSQSDPLFEDAMQAAQTQFLSCPGDLDGDGVVALADLAALLANYGATGPGVIGDLDSDDDVDLSDLAAILAAYGGSC